MPLKIVRRHKSPYWYLRGTIRGIAVDESTQVTERAAAEEIRIRRETELLERSIHGQRQTATFLEAAIMYMENGGSTRFMRPVVDYFGTTLLSKIDQTAIDRAAMALYQDAKPSTRNRQLYTPVSAVLAHAAKRGLCERIAIERPRQPKGRERWLTPDEAERLIGACSGHLKPLVVFMLYTGARVSEAIYLRWHEVDLPRAHVTFLDTKNNEDRGVTLHSRVVAELANLEHRSGAVFRRPDGLPYTRKNNAGGQIKTAFNGACRRAGIQNFRPHDCRHTWATWHYAENRNLPALMKLGGWKSERMVLRYAHVNVADLAASIEALPWGKSGERQKSTLKKQRKSNR